MTTRLKLCLLLVPVALSWPGVHGAWGAPSGYRFGAEQPAVAAVAFGPWSRRMERWSAQQTAYTSCMNAAGACPHYLRGYRRLVSRARGADRRGQLYLVNRFMNARRWVDESTGPGQVDQWKTLTDFLRDGGDCEDFAAAKYSMLRELGVPADDLRIVVVREAGFDDVHAVLAVRYSQGALLLESDDTILRPAKQRAYEFLYSVNEHGVWDHAPAGAPGILQRWQPTGGTE